MSDNDPYNTPKDKEPSPWKPTKFGEWSWYDKAIEDDPSLQETLKPIDAFEGFSNEFKYKVKVNTNGSIIVYRSSRLSKTINGSYNDKKQSTRSLSNNQGYIDHFPKREKVNVKMIKYEEFTPEEGWEIDNVSICVIRDEPYVVMVQWKVNTTS